RARPFDAGQQAAGAPDSEQSRDHRQGVLPATPESAVAEQTGAEHGDEAQQPDSANRCPAGQPGVGVGVALIQPGKAGEEPAAKKLLADPESGEAETCQPGTRLRTQPAGPKPGGQRRDQRQSGHQTSGQQGCQGRCGITMHVDADIDPGYTAEKQSQSPAPAAPQRLTALQAPQALVQQGNGQQAQR